MMTGNEFPELIGTLQNLLQSGFKEETYNFNENHFLDRDIESINQNDNQFMKKHNAANRDALKSSLQTAESRDKRFPFKAIYPLVDLIAEKYGDGSKTRLKRD